MSSITKEGPLPFNDPEEWRDTNTAKCIMPGWDETRFLGRDRDRVIRGVEFLYETETEKFYLEDYSTRPRPRNSIYKFFVRDETETRLDWFFLNETRPRRDQIENCPRDRDETRRDRDETETRPRQKKAKLWWSFYINKKLHVLILVNGSCQTKLSIGYVFSSWVYGGVGWWGLRVILVLSLSLGQVERFLIYFQLNDF